MNSKQQGDIGVSAAIFHYTALGHAVSIPMGDNTRYDLIVDQGGKLHRVQVKSTKHRNKWGTYEVRLATSGGNRSATSTVKTIDASECDTVFVYRLDGVAYEFPAEHVAGKVMLNLGAKQDAFRVSLQLM